MSRKKFSRVLEDVGVDLTSRDLSRVMDKFEKRDKVDYGKFLKSGGNQPVRRVHDGDAAVLAPSSGEEPAPPRHRAGVASMAWTLKKLKKELAKLEDKKGRRLKFDKYFGAYDSEGKDYGRSATSFYRNSASS